MQIFSLAIALLSGSIGFYLGHRAFKNFGYLSVNEFSFSYMVLTSILAGGAGTFMFFSIIMVMGFLDATYVWTVEKFLGAIVVSLILGGVIAIGSLGQAVWTSGYRKILLGAFKRKGKIK